jgi:hypothetical protein
MGLVMATAGWVATPAPAAAAWNRTLSISFYDGNGYGDGQGRVTSDDGGIDCSYNNGSTSGDCSEAYVTADFVASFDVTLSLNPAYGSFGCTAYTGDCDDGGGTIAWTVHFLRGSGGDVTEHPSLTRRMFPINIDLTGSGTVSSPNGDPCTPDSGFDTCFLFPYNTVAELQASSGSTNFGYWFAYGADLPCSGVHTAACFVNVDGPYNLGAVFGVWELTLKRVGSGTVCIEGDLCPTGASGSGYLKPGSYVAVASPAAGWRVDHWSIGACGSAASCTINLDAHKTVTVTFEQIPTATATPRPSATPRPTPSPTRTPTPTPSATSKPSATATVRPSPTAATTAPPSAAPSDAPGALPGASGLEATLAPGAAPSGGIDASASPATPAGATPASSAAPGGSPGESPPPAGAAGAASQPPQPADAPAAGGISTGAIVMLLLGLVALLAIGWVVARRRPAPPPRSS